MLKAATRNVLGHKLRLILTALSIVLGVAFVAGSFILTDAMKNTFNALADSGNSDVYVRGVVDKTSLNTDQLGDARAQLPLSLQDKIKAVPGVQRVYPNLQGTAIVIGKNGKAAYNGGAPTLGFGWPADPKAWTLVSGHAPTTSSEVALEQATLQTAKLKLGEQTRVVVSGQVIPVTVVGVVRTPNDAGLLGATATIFDPGSAQQYYASGGQVGSFSVEDSPGVSPTQVRDRIAQALPQANVLTGQQLVDETKKNLDNGVVKVFKIFFLVFAFIAVFVGAFVILNTFSMLVAQRTRELALLRALGASRRQVTRSVLVEAVIVGAFSSLVGLGFGAVIAAGLKGLLSHLGLKIQGGLPIGPWTVFWCFVVGVGVTLVAAYFPARRAARIPPVAAMRDDIALPTRSLHRRLIVGLAMLVVGVVVMILGLSGTTSHSGPYTGFGAGLTVIAVTVLAPVIAPSVMRFIGIPVAAAWKTTGKLARANAIRNPRRSAATASALMIGLALVTGITVLASSAKATFAKAFNTDLTAQYALTGVANSPVPASLATSVRSVPGVATVAEYTGMPILIGKTQYQATASVGSDLVAAQHVDMSAGSASSLDRGQILVSSKQAKSEHWSIGQQLTGRVATKETTFTIGGIYTNDQLLGGMVVPRSWYDAAVPANERSDFAVAVITTDGKTHAAVQSALEKLADPYAIVNVQTKSQYLKDQAGQVNTLLYLLYALLGLAVIIAIFGIINTLALSVFERTREIGLLRAVGMARRQLRRVIRLESVIISVFGALMGIVLGLYFGIAVQRALSGSGLDVLDVPVVRLIVFVILAALAGIFAAIWPARRAAKLDVLKAITTE